MTIEEHPRWVVLVGALVVLASVPSVTASYHDQPEDLVRDPCPTNPAFNATSRRGVPVDARGMQAVHVDIPDFEPFDPATLRIDAGTCIEWHNVGTLTHTITIETDTVEPRESTMVDRIVPNNITHRFFHEPGTYYLHCEVNTFHEATMHQVIRVEDTQESNPTAQPFEPKPTAGAS